MKTLTKTLIASAVASIAISAHAADEIAQGTNASATGDAAVAIGTNSVANGEYAVAIGQDAKASGSRSVALGDHSSATGETSLALAGGTANGKAALALQGTAKGDLTLAAGNNAVASGAYATAVGTQAKATAVAATAVGDGAKATERFATATGTAASASGLRSTAIGTEAKAANENDTAVGARSETRAVTATDSATVGDVTYSGFAGNNPTSAFAVGSVGSERQVQNVAAGQITADSTDAVNGSQLYAVANQVSANKAAAANAQSTADAAQASADAAQTTANTAVVKADAAQASADDAMKEALNKTVVKSGSSNVEVYRSGLNEYSVAVDAPTRQELKVVDAKVDANTSRINSIDSRMNSMRKDIRAAAATGIAHAGLPQVIHSGKSMVAVAAGGYQGQHAFAAGYSRASDNGKHIIKASVSIDTRKNAGYSVGYGYQW